MHGLRAACPAARRRPRSHPAMRRQSLRTHRNRGPERTARPKHDPAVATVPPVHHSAARPLRIATELAFNRSLFFLETSGTLRGQFIRSCPHISDLSPQYKCSSSGQIRDRKLSVEGAAAIHAVRDQSRVRGQSSYSKLAQRQPGQLLSGSVPYYGNPPSNEA